MRRNFKIWCNNSFTEAQQNELNFLRENLGGSELILFAPEENGARGEAAKVLREADIAFGAPNVQTAMNAENLKWIQLSSAGYAPFDRADFKEKLKQCGGILTNSSAVYSEPCAQHILAMMLGLARFLPVALDDQRGAKLWKQHEIRSESYLLNGQAAMIFGFGNIGKRLAELLAPFNMNVIGVKRTAQADKAIRIVSATESDALLPEADHVINVLPANDSTNNFFDAERLSKTKRSAKFYNIGRGTTVDQNALIEKLENGEIAAAYLDVTNPEPLLPDNPLWATKNCYITPHTAGGHTTEKIRQVKHFLDNFRRFAKGENLTDRVF